MCTVALEVDSVVFNSIAWTRLRVKNIAYQRNENKVFVKNIIINR